uniref:Aspartic peptidase DDI1-type domain-containing protein n=1 Tax=Vitis vinifera TaxID=29760 RepID=A5ARS8_VITVI|nr:hypothetical protein VITISV_004314 [Vitis vinifera]
MSFRSSGIQESNALNGVQIIAEMKKLWPLEDNRIKLKGNFASCEITKCKLRNQPFLAKLKLSACEIFTARVASYKIHFQTSSEDVSSENEWLDFLSLGIKEAGPTLGKASDRRPLRYTSLSLASLWEVRDVKAMITLRSGKVVELQPPKPHDEIDSEEETEKREKIKGKKKESSERKEDHDSTVNEDLEKIVINGDVMKKHMPPPFPQALHGKKGIHNASEILEVLRQVKVNIPLLDMIKQVSNYAKFLKDLCTIKRGLNVNKKAFLTEQVSAIIQCKSPVKYKDLGYPTISVMIGGMIVEKALLDLGASVNLLPYSVYKQLGLGELKTTSITLSLADRSVKIPRGMIEDVLVQVDNFYYPVGFFVLDIDPIVKETNYVPIILRRPFLATSNAIINCKNGLMQLTFGNMTLELNIFYMCKKPINPDEEEGPEEVCTIDTLVEEHCNQKIQEKLNESLGDLRFVNFNVLLGDDVPKDNPLLYHEMALFPIKH